MIYLDGKKYACSACIRGHRASSCNHTSRELTEIRPKGRPVTQCERCRQLRKTRKAHVKCLCGEMDSASPAAESPTSSATTRVEASQASKLDINALLNPCKCSASDICVCCRPVIKDYINRNYTLEVVEEAAADALVRIGEPIIMGAPPVSRTADVGSGITAVCPSGPNAPCCRTGRSSNGAVTPRQSSRLIAPLASTPRLEEPSTTRFKVERRTNGASTPQLDSGERLMSGSAPQFRMPTGRNAERSNDITLRALDRYSNGEERQHRHHSSEPSAVAATLSHDSGIQLSPGGMHYSDSAPGSDGRPNCKCGCDCGTFLDKLIRAIEDRVRGAMPLAEAEAGGDTAAMNRFIREILSPLDNPLMVPASSERSRQRRDSESAMSISQGSEAYDAGDSLRIDMDDHAEARGSLGAGSSLFAAGVGAPISSSCCAPPPLLPPVAEAATAQPTGGSCCSSVAAVVAAPAQASCCSSGGTGGGEAASNKTQCCSGGVGGSVCACWWVVRRAPRATAAERLGPSEAMLHAQDSDLGTDYSEDEEVPALNLGNSAGASAPVPRADINAIPAHNQPHAIYHGDIVSDTDEGLQDDVSSDSDYGLDDFSSLADLFPALGAHGSEQAAGSASPAVIAADQVVELANRIDIYDRAVEGQATAPTLAERYAVSAPVADNAPSADANHSERASKGQPSGSGVLDNGSPATGEQSAGLFAGAGESGSEPLSGGCDDSESKSGAVKLPEEPATPTGTNRPAHVDVSKPPRDPERGNNKELSGRLDNTTAAPAATWPQVMLRTSSSGSSSQDRRAQPLQHLTGPAQESGTHVSRLPKFLRDPLHGRLGPTRGQAIGQSIALAPLPPIYPPGEQAVPATDSTEGQFEPGPAASRGSKRRKSGCRGGGGKRRCLLINPEVGAAFVLVGDSCYGPPEDSYYELTGTQFGEQVFGPDALGKGRQHKRGCRGGRGRKKKHPVNFDENPTQEPVDDLSNELADTPNRESVDDLHSEPADVLSNELADDPNHKPVDGLQGEPTDAQPEEQAFPTESTSSPNVPGLDVPGEKKRRRRGRRGGRGRYKKSPVNAEDESADDSDQELQANGDLNMAHIDGYQRGNWELSNVGEHPGGNWEMSSVDEDYRGNWEISSVDEDHKGNWEMSDDDSEGIKASNATLPWHTRSNIAAPMMPVSGSLAYSSWRAGPLSERRSQNSVSRAPAAGSQQATTRPATNGSGRRGGRHQASGGRQEVEPGQRPGWSSQRGPQDSGRGASMSGDWRSGQRRNEHRRQDESGVAAFSSYSTRSGGANPGRGRGCGRGRGGSRGGGAGN
ncbi:copper-binding transcription factor [Coemansia sp. BCRC 34962]|nr:copper-binding transcription factor [Coemansia sp. BCRC 34962]